RLSTITDKVGIGITSPTEKLEVSGNTKVTGTLFTSTLSSTSPLSLQTGGTTRIYLDDAFGNVGIGTTNPDYPLVVQGTAGTYVQVKTGQTDEYDTGLNFGDANSPDDGAVIYNHFYKRMGFTTNGVYGRMVISSAGNVGIGTTSPQGALDVSSTTGAFIVPRMTTAERDALTTVNGMIIYNTTTNQFNFYENDAWVTK
ncbi:MAG: hypothetical protein QME52_14140, partial [Bacteroidota bacterium]|nr:hypothetical protein [Bacteroidota bacterium]